MRKSKSYVLPIIVIAQFCCTSLWFASNGVMNELASNYSISSEDVGHITSAVQFGFIAGTLVFAIFTLSDRFSPSKVFLFSALLGALFNFATILEGNTLLGLFSFRFLTGFFLAGIYPVGMKIAADHFEKGLGKSLGFLVGALVLGTAFPHFIKAFTLNLPWRSVIWATSGLAVFGGILLFLLVKDGPYAKKSTQPDFSLWKTIYKQPKLKISAFGYFGHMWELYTFWAFVPVILFFYQENHDGLIINIPWLSFLIIGLGSFGCIIGGYLSEQFGTKKVATYALFLSGCCCLLSPLMYSLDLIPFITFLIFWGLVVIADSPLFSTLVAQNAVGATKGTALTLTNCIGFAITIISLQIIGMLIHRFNPTYVFTILAIGPVFGLYHLMKNKQ